MAITIQILFAVLLVASASCGLLPLFDDLVPIGREMVKVVGTGTRVGTRVIQDTADNVLDIFG